jgi:hypothetical protein
VPAVGREVFSEAGCSAGTEAPAGGEFFFLAVGLLPEGPQPATAKIAMPKTANTIRCHWQNSLGHISISQIKRHPICS